MSLTRREKAIVVLVRLENTALYFFAGFLLGKIAPSFFWPLLAIIIAGFVFETVFFSRFTKFLAFGKNVTEDELFVDFVTHTVPTCVAYFLFGFIIARIL